MGIEGSFDGRTYTSCHMGEQPYSPPNAGKVTGSWRVNLHDGKATARFVIHVGGALHVAYTTQMKRTDDGSSDGFTAKATTGAGDLTVTLAGGDLTCTIAPYTDPFGGRFVCDSVVYTGTTG